MAIELKNVTFAYPNGFVANENLNLKIEEGERVAIIGQNGAGKTTAVKLMNGLNKPTEGDVIIDGKSTKDHTVAQISAHVGYVFQNPDEQIFNNTARAEIEYMLKYKKMDEKEIKRRLKKVCQLTDTIKDLKKNPYELPYSTRKFVAIAAILATEVPYLILDEPTAGQDRHGVELLENIMNVMQEEGKSVITITHDMEFVANNFDRVVVMANKHIICDDSVRNVFYNEPVLEESRIKKPELAQIAQGLGLDGQILYTDELVDALP